ncbi:hypothetical protein JTB14_002480 [Gonioctena quinquepunctata]|nr:hypothetical protein JTB14_002480 [Gonioctena quinquepunctata]
MLPGDRSRRLKWLRASRRKERDISLSSCGLYVCEDHFNLQEDMDNYIKFKLIGGQKKMKPTVVPHIFDCQPDRKISFTQPPRSAAVKRLKRQIIDEAVASTSTSFEENLDFWENTGGLAKPKDNHYNNGIIVKNEDNSEWTEDSSTTIVELKTETLKTEYDIDFIYEDVKPQIWKEKSSGKNENGSCLNSITDISIGTEVGPNFSIAECLQKLKDTAGEMIVEDNRTPILTMAGDTSMLPPKKFHTIAVQTDETPLDESPVKFNYFMCNRETSDFTNTAEVQVSLASRKPIKIDVHNKSRGFYGFSSINSDEKLNSCLGDF